jgi:hypothetical protein
METATESLRPALAYWREKRGAARAPRWDQLDPVLEIPSLLARIFVVDVESDGGYRFRLLGSEIITRAGRNATGRRFETLYPDELLVELCAIYGEVCTLVEPRLFRDRPPDGSRRHTSTLLLPLIDRDGRVTRILGMLGFESDIDYPRNQPLVIERLDLSLL